MKIRAVLFAAIIALLVLTGCDTTQPLDTSGETRTAMISINTLNSGESILWDLWVYGVDFNGDTVPDDLDGDGIVDSVYAICEAGPEVAVSSVPSHFTVEFELVNAGSTEVMLITPEDARRMVLNNLSVYDDTENVLDVANSPIPFSPILLPLFGVQATGAGDAFFQVLGSPFQFGTLDCPLSGVEDPGTAGIGIDIVAGRPDFPASGDFLSTDYCLFRRCRNDMPFEVEMEKGSTLIVNIRRSDLAIRGLSSTGTPSLATVFTVDGQIVIPEGNTDTIDPTGSIQFIYTSE
jgi:hypothetical protein